ncbi:hypothetical protein EXM98_02920 [Clostridium botulinum]|uniref:hypothetical protein n=1 Tax=Clostridium botulinum TaxID=1491 RepID=UPI0005F9571D|nr:hypothetical protein [Clostridium botulinum]NFC28017.1 hypothetical protein [Clostridium botulinum]NFC61374.1 hypothetical protein [Clostridium botulinum]NFC68210.1 hypothetical protein [Clostridium botulinum]NFE36934.1 hypothetical protein [Clostridium botulinum]NFE40706.1 hypothetical protein [Clostridium botulinum]
MLIPVKIKDSIEIEDIGIENTNFKSLNLTEEHKQAQLKVSRGMLTNCKYNLLTITFDMLSL